MSRVVSLRQRIRIGIIVITLCLLGWSRVPAREMLLFVSNAGYEFYCLQLLPTGQLVTTGQAIAVGSDDTFGFAVSPDQRYIWSSYSDSTSQGIHQYEVSPNGQISTTGCLVQLPDSPYDLSFTPNGQLLIIAGGPIFRVNPDSSIQSTSNVYSNYLSISPRGDINYCYGGYPEAFEIDKIDYTSASLTTLEVVTAGNEDQPQYPAVYRPAGDYIAYTYFDGYPGGVEVRRVLPNGMVDTTTQVWDYEPGNGGFYIDITPDGNNIYANNMIHLSWSNQSSMFFDSGKAASLSSVFQLKVSPDGKFLVVVTGDQLSLKTFSIQTDGSLVDTGYTFDFGSTFNAFISGNSRLIFDWTPLPTSVPEELWKDPPSEIITTDSQEILN